MGTYVELTQSLADAFNTLADEAQGLNDRRIVLEHKLRFAHEQVSQARFSFCTSTRGPQTPNPLRSRRPTSTRPSSVSLPDTDAARLAYITTIDGLVVNRHSRNGGLLVLFLS